MKKKISFQRRKISCFYSALMLLLISMFVLGKHNAMCQGSNENSSKIHASMNISCKITDGVKHIKVQITRKENGKRISVDNMQTPVNLYLNTVKKNDLKDGTGWISSLIPDEEGSGVFEFPADFNSLTSRLHTYTFIAKVNSDPIYEDTETELTISDAKIHIDYSGKDSIKTATATLTVWKDTAYVPVAGTELKLSIQRAFSLFPFGAEGLTTDKNGRVSADLPLDIPGEVGGTITIVASVLDNENYGTVESTKKVDWSVLPTKREEMGRTLWSKGNNAPIPLVVIACSIIAGIWGTLIYIVLQLFKVKRIGKQQAS